MKRWLAGKRRLVVFALAGFATADCSSSSSTDRTDAGDDGPNLADARIDGPGEAATPDADSGVDGAGGPVAACVPGKVTVLGALDDERVDGQFERGGARYQTLDLPYSLVVQGATGPVLNIEFDSQPIEGGPAVVARGFIVMPTGGPHAGETICAAGGSFWREAAAVDAAPFGPYHFTLTMLSVGPTCPGAALAGTLTGCAD